MSYFEFDVWGWEEREGQGIVGYDLVDWGVSESFWKYRLPSLFFYVWQGVVQGRMPVWSRLINEYK
jgi:hypothetical protein